MQAQRLPATRGIRWLAEGFALYKRNPPLLTMLTLGYLMLVAAFGLLQPIGQVLMPLALPALTVLIANACRAIDRSRQAAFLPETGTLTAGLAKHRAVLLRLGLLYLAGMMVVIGLDRLLAVAGGASSGDGLEGEPQQLGDMLRLMALALPLLLAFWFAPLLSAWQGVPAAKSLFFSFVAAWRNWPAFLAYGCAVAVLGVILPSALVIGASTVSPQVGQMVSLALQGVLLLIFAPVLMATVYLSYRDVFLAAPDAATHAASDVSP